MIGELKKRELLRKAYQDLIDREGRPDPAEIREKIYDIGPHRIMSVVCIERRAGKEYLMIHNGTMGRAYKKSLVFHLHPSGQVRHIPVKDIIDIIDSVYENPFPRRVHDDQK
ncbi:MAG: hypothetical protein ACYDAP_03585 [Thermoplasmataceae archaeon]